MGAGTQMILGGLLSGLGRGVEQTAIANREAALQRLRMQYEGEREERAATRQEVRDKTQAGQTMERDEAQQGHALERLRVGGDIQSRRDQSQQAHEVRITTLRSRLDTARTAAEIRLRDRLGDDDVQDVVVDAEGNYVIVTRGGALERSNVPARAASATASEGGRLTEDERDTAYQAARRTWREGGQVGPAPTREDFIGMTREDYRASQGGGTPAPARRPTANSARAAALAELGTVYGNATPERYPGLFRNGRKIPLAEARRMIEGRYPD